MSSEIICVYQDCAMCGDRGKKLKEFIFDNKLNVRKVSFASPEGEELCNRAVFEHGIKAMPFFTDGTKFSTSIEDLIKKKSPSKKTRKSKKVRLIDNESD